MDLFAKGYLKKIFAEIEGPENRARRYKAYVELDIYNKKQAKYVNDRLNHMYGKDGLSQKINEINLAHRIVDAEASIYKRDPVRQLTNASEAEKLQVEELYEQIDANQRLKLANKLYKLGDQCAMMVVPDRKAGGLKARVLYPHQLDVIPSEDDPTIADVYIIPIQTPKQYQERIVNYNQNLGRGGDGINQVIADQDDSKLSEFVYLVWSDLYVFKANGKGELLDNESLEVVTISEAALNERLNPIGRLPFIDVAADKLSGFFVDGGSDLSNFTITFCSILSDTSEVNRLQGFAQPVISAAEMPKSMTVGPTKVLFLKQDPNAEQGAPQPKFEFVTPSADINASLNFVETILRLFLTSRGTDAKLITSQAISDYKSGFERLLAMIDRSEATIEDKVLFKRVEREFFDLVVLWNNYLQDNDREMLQDYLRGTKISDQVYMTVEFSDPAEIQTAAEKEASVTKRMESRLMSRIMAIMELYGLDRDTAIERLKEIDTDDGIVEIEGDETNRPELDDDQSEQEQVVAQGPTDSGVNVQQLALNGAQVTSLIEIVQSVGVGNLPRESGIAMVKSAFNFNDQQAASIMSTAGTSFKPTGAQTPQEIK